MILRLFKSDNPFALAGIPLLAALLFTPWFMAPKTVDFGLKMPLFEAVSSFPENLWWLSGLISVVFISITAIVLVRLVNRLEFSDRNTMLPGYLYVLTSAGVLQSMGPSPILFANLFLILAFWRMANSYGRHTAYAEVFEAGLLIGIASLFYLPCVLMLIFVWLNLIIHRPFIWREWIIPIFGWLTPQLFALTWWYWNDELTIIDQLTTFTSLFPERLFHEDASMDLLWAAFFVIILLFGITHFFRELRKSVMRNKKLKQAFLAFTFTIVLCFGSTYLFTADDFRVSLLALPLAVILSFYFQQARWTWLAEIFLWLWIGICGLQFYLLLEAQGTI